MHIDHLIVSGSLAYDLIIQLDLTHRHLIDTWPNQQHLSIVHDNNNDELYRSFNDYQKNDASEEKSKYSKIQSYNEHMHLLTELTFQLRDETKQIKSFALSLAGEPSSVSILYLDHNLLNDVPLKALYNATGLNELYLSYNNINHLPAYAFGFSYRLIRLDLSYNQISSMNDSTFHRHPNAFAGPFLIDYLDFIT